MKRRRFLTDTDPLAVLAPVVAVVLALLLGGLILLALGSNPVEAYLSMWEGAFGNPFENPTRLINTITRSIPLLLVAVGICIAFRGGVINIGAEGQLLIGAISVTAFSVGVGDRLPPLIFVPLALLVGSGAGAIWGAVPGYLKARFAVNEILSTVMMNQIAIQFVLFLLSGPLIDPREVELGTRIPQSAKLPTAVWLGRLLPPTRLHAGLFIALITAVLVWLLLWRTPLGYRLRAVGQSRDASRYAGISVPLYLTLALTLSGALAGLAGAVELIGVPHRMVEGFAVGLRIRRDCGCALRTFASSWRNSFRLLFWGDVDRRRTHATHHSGAFRDHYCDTGDCRPLCRQQRSVGAPTSRASRGQVGQ